MVLKTHLLSFAQKTFAQYVFPLKLQGRQDEHVLKLCIYVTTFIKSLCQKKYCCHLG